MTRWLRNTLGATELRLWHMIVGFAIATVISLGYTEWSNKARHKEDQRSQEIVAFVNSANKFDTLSQIYVGSLLDKNKVNEGARQELLANMQEQNALLDAASSHLPREKRALASSYADRLGTLSDEVREISSATQMSAFWSEMSDTLVARQALVAEFRREVDQPISGLNSESKAAE